METNSETKKESRECGKGEAIRRGANIQKYVDNYDRISARALRGPNPNSFPDARTFAAFARALEALAGVKGSFCAGSLPRQKFSGRQTSFRSILSTLINPRKNSPATGTE